MDWKTFISQVIDSLAWPATVLITLYVLHAPIFDSLNHLSKARYKGLEFEFIKASKGIREETENAIKTEKLKSDAIQNNINSLLKVSEVSPRGAILEAWRLVDRAASKRVIEIDKLRENNEGAVLLRSQSSIWPSLLKEGVINNDQYKLMKKLKNLRNIAVHADDESFSSIDSEDYIRSAAQLAEFLSNNATLRSCLAAPERRNL